MLRNDIRVTFQVERLFKHVSGTLPKLRNFIEGIPSTDARSYFNEKSNWHSFRFFSNNFQVQLSKSFKSRVLETLKIG